MNVVHAHLWFESFVIPFLGRMCLRSVWVPGVITTNKSSWNYTVHYSSSSLDTWQSFPCSWEGKKMLSISPLLSSSERWILGEDVGWNTGQSLSSSSSLLLDFSDVFPSTVGPTWPVNWLSKLKMTVPGLWTCTGPKHTLTSRERAHEGII